MIKQWKFFIPFTFVLNLPVASIKGAGIRKDACLFYLGMLNLANHFDH